jgi:hypothetical protein
MRTSACKAAARGGHLGTLVWLRDHDVSWDEDTCQAAAQGGHTELIAWARGAGCPWREERVFEFALIGGHIGIMDLVAESATPARLYSGMYVIAAERGDICEMDWLYAHSTPWTKLATLASMRDSPDASLAIIKWALARGLRLHPDTARAAGHALIEDVLRWEPLWSSSPPLCLGPDPHCAKACAAAARAGRVDLLRLLHARGFAWDHLTASELVAAGDTPAFEWFLSKGGKPSTGTSAVAASHGRLDVLEMLEARGLPLHHDLASHAASGEQEAAMRWAVARPGARPPSKSAMNTLMRINSVRMMRAARECGAPWPSGLCAEAAKAGRVEVLRFALEDAENVNNLTADTAMEAARHGKLEALQVLRAAGCPWDSRVLKTPCGAWAAANGLAEEASMGAASKAHKRKAHKRKRTSTSTSTSRRG